MYKSQACHWACNTVTALYEDCLQACNKGCQQDCNKDNIVIDDHNIFSSITSLLHAYYRVVRLSHCSKNCVYIILAMLSAKITVYLCLGFSYYSLTVVNKLKQVIKRMQNFIYLSR